ncbi:MAG: hypothetical protein K9L61_02095 [Candidatus Omnitrophica bacterium]|nr:hypothetical protein [Candidatus Omnitrophota bacterium]
MKKKNKIIITLLPILLLGVGLYSFNQDFIGEKINSFFGEKIEIMGSKFGLVTGYRGDVPKLKETDIITLGDNVQFGWVIATDVIDKSINWQEVILFPEKPLNLIVTDATKVSSNGKKAVTKKTFNLEDGLIYNSWALSKEDPLGEYKIKVYAEGKLLKTFSFQVKADKK